MDLRRATDRGVLLVEMVTLRVILVAMPMHHVVMVTPRVTRVVRTTPREPPRATKSASRAPLVV
jgi:hypothetical protein